MKKTAYIIAILAVFTFFAPTEKASAASYGYGDAFSYYQYPIPWYVYFETPNATARNYYPSNYSVANNSGPRYYSTGSGNNGYYSDASNNCQYSYYGCSSNGNGFSSGNGYNNGYGSNSNRGNGGGFSSSANNTTSNTSNPSFHITGTAPVTFTYIAE
jgi:hypothetical protein